MTKSSRETRRHTKSEYSIRKSEGAIGRRRTHLPLLPVNQIKNILGTQWPAYAVPHSIKNAFVLTRHEEKELLIINPLICHVIYRTKSIVVLKHYETYSGSALGN